MKSQLFFFALVVFSGCSCSTLFHGKSKQSAKSQSSIQAAPSSQARVQGIWQARFEMALQEAGTGAEGWALFSDSPMGHTGQQMVIRHTDGELKLCYASQAENDCTYQSLSADKWQPLFKVTTTSDGLGDRPLQTFDTLNLEYVHLKNNRDTIVPVARVFFMADVKPLPNDYNLLLNAFTSLNK